MSRIVTPAALPPPPPKPSVRSRVAKARKAIWAFAVPAKELSPLEESPWQRGKREADELANGRAILFMIICAPLFAVGGLFVLTNVWWPLRVVLAALIGLGVALVATSVIASGYALRAPYRQSKDARKRLRELESQFESYQTEVELRFSLMTIANTIKDGIDGARTRVVGGEDLEADRTFFRNITSHVAVDLERAGLRHLADDFRTEDYRLDEPNDVLNAMSQFGNKLLALVSDAQRFPEASRLLTEREGAA
jgi:hypothetical protein